MTIKNNLEKIQENLQLACEQANRDTAAVRLMAVSKTKSLDRILEAISAGHSLFGENRVQEISEKWEKRQHNVELHMIGHLQSNKAAKVAEFVDCVQSIDKLKTARILDKSCAALQKRLSIFLEYNTSHETSKNGYRNTDSLFQDLDQILELKQLGVRGLMTIGPFGASEKEVRKAFSSLRELREKILARYPELPCHELSMGMSDDFSLAILEGSTMIRVGTGIFGNR